MIHDSRVARLDFELSRTYHITRSSNFRDGRSILHISDTSPIIPEFVGKKCCQSNYFLCFRFDVFLPLTLPQETPKLFRSHSFLVFCVTMAGFSRPLGWYLFLVLIGTNTDFSAAMSATGCEEVFVGAGWAGVYSFYRRIMDDPSRGPKACLFEESWRVGGRTYSVHTNHTDEGKDFVQDVGAYRFSPDMHLPGDLIMHDLDLVTECYAQDCPNPSLGAHHFDYNAPLRRIIDPETKQPAGYVTPMWKMIEIAESYGGRVFKQTPLVKLIVDGDEDTLSLEFDGANKNLPIVVQSPSILMLNLPRNKLFDIEGVEKSLGPIAAKTLKCNVNDFAGEFGLEPGAPSALEKAYLYYSDAWWRTILEKVEGYWPSSEFGVVASVDSKGLLFNLRYVQMVFNFILVRNRYFSSILTDIVSSFSDFMMDPYPVIILVIAMVFYKYITV